MINVIICVDVHSDLNLSEYDAVLAIASKLAVIPSVKVSFAVESGNTESGTLLMIEDTDKLRESALSTRYTGTTADAIKQDALKQLSDPVQEMPFKPATAEIRDKQQQNRRRQNYHSKHHKK